LLSEISWILLLDSSPLSFLLSFSLFLLPPSNYSSLKKKKNTFTI
jgi:hypothetical protein